MSIWESIILAFALSADAATVSLSDTICYPNMRRRYCFTIPFLFGLFQGIMPLIGFFLLRKINFGEYGKILTFAIFLFLGGKMLYDALIGSKKENQCLPRLTPAVVLVQALTTSIDAFTVGVSFAAESIRPFFTSALITAVTFATCLAAINFGKKITGLVNEKSMLIGAVLLILLAFKALI